ncbi:MAG TPA: DUF4388 domain-containing protein [Thermoanaerobaculia bacterium]|nr:DUF4388 domain-containing protein [Thermoanaerobaculia bacterium]
MSLSGALEDLSLPDVLQVLASNRLSGTLWVTGRGGRGRLVLRHGRLVGAATETSRETVGRLLLEARLVTERQLAAALEVQRAAGRRKRLGTILVERGELAPQVLRRVVAGQFCRVLAELFGWRSGHLHFENQALGPGHGADDGDDVLSRHGIETAPLVLAGLTGADGGVPAEPGGASAARTTAESRGR